MATADDFPRPPRPGTWRALVNVVRHAIRIVLTVSDILNAVAIVALILAWILHH